MGKQRTDDKYETIRVRSSVKSRITDKQAELGTDWAQSDVVEAALDALDVKQGEAPKLTSSQRDLLRRIEKHLAAGTRPDVMDVVYDLAHLLDTFTPGYATTRKKG